MYLLVSPMILVVVAVEGHRIGPKVNSYIRHQETGNGKDNKVFEFSYE